MLVDAGAEIDRYMADVTRTYVVGEPSAFQSTQQFHGFPAEHGAADHLDRAARVEIPIPGPPVQVLAAVRTRHGGVP